MKKILVIKTGSTFSSLRARRGDFEQWIISGMHVTQYAAVVVDVSEGESLPNSEETAGVVITGSHAMVTDHHEWSENTAAWLQNAFAAHLPILGICYGHQLLAYALGGKVGDNPKGREVGTVDVYRTGESAGDKLLGEPEASLKAQVSHSQTVLTLPPEATRLAYSDLDPNQAFIFGDRVWGLQFHPEFDADIIRAYVQYSRDKLVRENRDPDTIMMNCKETPESSSILRRFAGLLDGWEENP
jgi:GMP synthase (glutamine-hydrolysing)